MFVTSFVSFMSVAKSASVTVITLAYERALNTVDEMMEADEIIVTSAGSLCIAAGTVDGKAVGGKATRFGFVIFNNNWKTMKSAPYHLDFSEGITNGFDDTKLKVLKYAD